MSDRSCGRSGGSFGYNDGLTTPFSAETADNGIIQRGGVANVASPDGLSALLRGQYFSVITFTTIGYVNVAPIGPGSRLLVGLESFAGTVLMALLVAVLARQITR